MAVLAVLVGVIVHVNRTADVRVRASSETPTSNSAALISGSDEASSADVAKRPVVWQTDGQTRGAWVELTWSRPTRVDHVEVRAAGDGSTAFTTATLTFGGAGALLLTADETGDAVVDFPGRTTSSARLTIADVPDGATSVSLAALSVDGSGPDHGSSVTAQATPTAPGQASALVDGDVAGGATGQEWLAPTGDPTAEVQLGWDSPRELASVQLFGPSQTTFDPANSAAAPLHGQLVFDDGSTVVVSGIAGGTGQATTIAFMPRMARSVRVELEKTIPAAVIGLREVVFHETGTTPPRWPVEDGYSTSSAAPASCESSAVPVATPQVGRLTLVCPSPSSTVDGVATIVVAADATTELQVSASLGLGTAADGAVQPVASGTAGADGRATLSFDTTRLPQGPLTVQVTASGPAAGSTPALFVQLYNSAGIAQPAAGHAPEGMTLQWDEEFTDPLSITQTGAGATYAATKPAYWGTSEFGDAVFADPADGAGNISTVGEDYLRIRAEPIGGRDVPAPYGQQHLGGILSSLTVGGGGFAAQYGYYETRMLGAPGAGTWPAFWMLDTDSATTTSNSSGEIDAVELYGHNTAGSCHALHNWVDGEDVGDVVDCKEDNGFSDWAMSWHTYGVRIVPTGAVYYIDGKQVAKIDGLQDHHSDPFFFMIDLALGGGWPIDLTATGNVSDLYVDWVHVYT
ncbi:DUF7402 domain-containing protein [Modestobacter italicus]|uniref:DUF7402 domain-containing protein n=1 Tax=Modestobacter italicus (strain DSM 44449 / CECT 9708 / BC 501) TaxID=2732864 RepID=UPI001412039D|nr:family 16 glycosylhydrolase [Modestobacter marinus]